MSKLIYISILLLISTLVYPQPVPNVDENIPYLMTFGNKAETSWGDDDFSQTFFFLIPDDYDQPFFIRVFDPDTGGEIDEVSPGGFNTRCVYEIFGGEGNWSDDDAQEVDPKFNYKSGTLLASRAFAENPRYDNDWFTFGPFNPAQGEHVENYHGYIFKIICEGVAGDDGNMYRYYLSTSATENRLIEGANAFAYEYSFRMHNDYEEVSHIYPYVEDGTISVRISNFDWDKDGDIMVISVNRQGSSINTSDEDHWTTDELRVQEEEIGTSFDFRFIKARPLVKNNNVVVNVRNQFGDALPFYTIPLGGVPKYRGEVEFVPID
ncbi:MAG: hypothetical protein E4H10_08390 [Bacteroidia bacterium]|nr:MAG: hypothetical protein E4H10_08390 [Bacteroidia bacterium]